MTGLVGFILGVSFGVNYFSSSIGVEGKALIAIPKNISSNSPVAKNGSWKPPRA